ncbi:hypothetical protein EV356DRAFT_505441 [Viridothelium virens]|uniref:Uncharacterized protein n=1 Tax=Viridothelium virens TaxID=1048519 RepID=A0A6A6H414_VIRVR|nr:hypothetical protein EV356DRAFT_505441 [Viridothelium virens]
MYITPELFGQVPALPADDCHYACNQEQPTTTMGLEIEHPNFALGKRKRQGKSQDTRTISSSSFVSKQTSNSLGPEVRLLSGSENTSRAGELHSSLSSTNLPHARLMTSMRDDPPPHKARRKTITPKALRTSHQKPVCENYSPSPSPSSKGASTIEKCHLCNRRPTQKQDLDAFADCLRCQKRTCFVCIRECSGSCWASRICSNCCVEKGEEGDTWCFECLGQSTDHEMQG